MKVNYFREMKTHHLVITAENCLCPDYQMKMLQNNEIEGLLRPFVRQVDGDLEYDYLITGYRSLQTTAESESLSGALIGALVEQLCRLLEEMERYMIDGEYLALRPEFIYLEQTNEGVGNIRYCFFPFQASDWDKQMKDLMKFVINEMDYREKQAVNPVYELFEEASREMIDLSEMKKTAGLLRKKISETEEKEGNNEGDKEGDADEDAKGKNMGESIWEMKESGEADKTVRGERKGRAGRTEPGRNEKAYPVVLRSEDILWMDGFGKYEAEKRKRQRRKSRGGNPDERREIALPGNRKKSILEVIGRRQRD